MQRAVNMVERTVVSDKDTAINVPAATATDVLPDERMGAIIAEKGEVVYREIFNAGANNAYYRFGEDCSIAAGNYNAWIVPGQMLEVATLERVSVYATLGTTISITVLRRRDLVPHTSNTSVNTITS